MNLLLLAAHLRQGIVKILGLVGPDLGGEELRPDEVAQHLLQGLAVLFVDAEQKEGQHQADHQQRRALVPHAAPGEEIGGNANQPACAEADELALGKVKGHLGLYFRQVLGDRHIGHDYASSLSASRTPCMI